MRAQRTEPGEGEGSGKTSATILVVKEDLADASTKLSGKLALGRKEGPGKTKERGQGGDQKRQNVQPKTLAATEPLPLRGKEKKGP